MTRVLSFANVKVGDLPTVLGSEIKTTNAQIEQMQRHLAKPRPYRFVIRKAAENETKKTGG